MRLKFTLLLVICFVQLFSQKVGLVLSGGGSKGITHIGVIKALEENNVPIDFISGTSIGAVVGGMYAMGFSPEKMIELIKSDDFRRWSTGEVELNYLYYYRNADPKPSFAEIPFSINKIDSFDLKSNIFPTNIISSRQMNYAFVPLCAQATAECRSDFNKLFVPFRCVASDIYKKKAVVLRRGDLGNAIRASMTFPFMFRPIVVDDCLLFDGGIYNNFPVDVMKKEFNPDVMIGSVVSNNPKKPSEHDIIKQVQNMIMNKTDYTISKEDGFMMKFELSEVKMFDFTQVDELVKMGYDSTMAHIEEIKERVKREVNQADLTQKREAYIKKLPVLKFQNVRVIGVDSLQRKYVEKLFHIENDVFSADEFKEAYFKLISDDKILEVIPQAIYNPKTELFDLKLQVRIQENLKLQVGGNVSSSTSNQAFFGITYQNITRYAQSAHLDAQFGKMYNGMNLGTRIEIPTKKNWYSKVGLVYHKFDFFEKDRLFYAKDKMSDFKQYEFYSKVSVGFPLTMKGRLEFGLGYGLLTDYYLQDRTQITGSTNADKSTFSLGSAFGRIENYTLNNIMYPTKGYNHLFTVQLLAGNERFKSGTVQPNNSYFNQDIWLQLKAKYDHYYPVAPRITIGVYAEAVISNREFLNNYTVSLTQAPTFRPTPHSKTLFNANYSANQYGAFGIKPIYHLSRQLHFRTEAYWFIPYKSILPSLSNSPIYSTSFSNSNFLGEAALVYNFRIASAGMFINYYSAAVSKINFGVNIGFLLFNSKFIE